jgi:hypothetical protein
MDTDVTVERAAGNVAHLERLLAAFGGSLEGWTLDPEVREQNGSDPSATPCACGHKPIRYLFFWRKERQIVVTGSHCVEKAPGITQELLQAMEAGLARLRAQQAEEARKAKEALQDFEVVRLLAEIDAGMREKYWRAYAQADRTWVDEDVYYARQALASFKGYVRHAKGLKTRSGRLRSLRVLLKELQPKVTP